jgi:2-methylcitrate dehydratase PrpD
VRTALGCRAEDLGPDGVRTIKLAILDLLGCCVAGADALGSRLVATWAHAASGARGDAVIIGTELRATPALAALANGASGHALDYDDVSVRMIHPSVTIVPALLAAGAARGATGRSLLDGYLAGFEVEARLCKALNPDHYARGWHTTGSIGTLGAALASCRALDLDEAPSRHALGVAASSAGSIRKNFGSMVKPLHAGQASFHGLQAAELAASGFTADTSVLEGPRGFLDVFSSLDRAAELAEAFEDDAPYELVASGIALKRFACCGAIHSAQDAILELRASAGFAPGDVDRIECRVNPLIPGILVHHVTQDPLEGKFSVEFCLAVCLADGRAGLAQYTAARAADPELLELMRRIDVVVDASIPVDLAYFPSVVTVSLTDGRRLSTRVDVPTGYPEKPLSVDAVVDKARECAAPTLGATRFDELVATVLHLEDLEDVGTLAALLAIDGDGRAS